MNGYTLIELTGDHRKGDIGRLDAVCFPKRPCAWPGPDGTMWWLALDINHRPAGYCALAPFGDNTGWLYRAGVLPEHRGHGLQQWFIAARERAADKLGWHTVVTNVNPESVGSINNLVSAGYRCFRPDVLWDGEGRVYLKRTLPHRRIT